LLLTHKEKNLESDPLGKKREGELKLCFSIAGGSGKGKRKRDSNELKRWGKNKKNVV